MVTTKMSRARIYVWWRKKRRNMFKSTDKLDNIQKTAMEVFSEIVADKDEGELAVCPVTFRRFATRGTDNIAMLDGAMFFVSEEYYYAVIMPVRTYAEAERMFDEELSKRLSNRHRRILSSVADGIGSLLAKSDASGSNQISKRKSQ